MLNADWQINGCTLYIRVHPPLLHCMDKSQGNVERQTIVRRAELRHRNAWLTSAVPDEGALQVEDGISVWDNYCAKSTTN